MDHWAKDVVCMHEFIKDRLYFVTFKNPCEPPCTSTTFYFSIDDELEYQSFYSDFGPLNLAMLYKYCGEVKDLLKCSSLTHKKIVHYTTQDCKKRVNAAFLIGSYSIIYLKKTPDEAYNILRSNNSPFYIPFRDASCNQCNYNLTLADCLHAVGKAVQNNFLNFDKFHLEEYEYYERVENGDFNWIVPNKFLAFCGPHSQTRFENGYPRHSPESYFTYFRKHNVTTIIRLNKKIYDADRFKNNGFEHYDLYFVDGSTPSDAIMERFLEISENAKGAIAVHCKAGLGRTGTLIGCYIMKHHHFTAAEAIAWVRICRPGSIIGYQQQWLDEKQGQFCYQGNLFQANKNANLKNNNIRSKNTITKSSTKSTDTLDLDERMDQIRINDSVTNTEIVATRSRKGRASNKISHQNTTSNDDNNNNEGATTQGDDLNRIKALRRQPRSHTTSGINNDNLKPHRRSSSQPFKPLASGATAAHSTYVSPLKPLLSPRLSKHVQLSRSSTSPVTSSPTQHSNKNGATNSSIKRKPWRHLLMSPPTSLHHWDAHNSLPHHSQSSRAAIHPTSPGSSAPAHLPNINLSPPFSAPSVLNFRPSSSSLTQQNNNLIQNGMNKKGTSTRQSKSSLPR